MSPLEPVLDVTRLDEAPSKGRFGRDIAPFVIATAAVFAAVFLRVGGARTLHLWPALAGGILAVATGITVAAAPWRRLPRVLRLLPILTALAVVGLLRAASGGATAGLGPAVLIPLLWTALYLGTFEIAATVVGIAALFTTPILAVGNPEYPDSQWRLAVIWTFFAAFVGFLVNRTVRRRRRMARIVDAHRVEAERAGSRLNAVIQAMDDGLVAVDPEMRVIASNPAADAIFGPPAELPLAERGAYYGIRDPESGEPLAAERLPLERALGGDEVDEEILVRNRFHPEGVPLRARARPLFGPGGEVAGALVVLHDVSNRHRLARYLRSAQAVMHDLAVSEAGEALPRSLATLAVELGWVAAAFYWEVDGELLRCRAAWVDDELGDGGQEFSALCRGLEFTRGQGLPGAAWKDADVVPMTEEMARTTEPDAPRREPAEHLGLSDGVAFPVFDDDEVIGVIELFSAGPVPDPEFWALATGVGHRFGEVLARRRADSEALRMKNEFVALVSHELRTPLTSIIGYLELLERRLGDGDEDVSRYLQTIGRNAGRLRALVEDLLFVARVDAASFELSLSSVNLAEVVSVAAEAARPVVEAKNIGLALELMPVPVLRGDRVMLAQVVDNLLSNAVKFTPEGGRVAMRLSADDGSLQLDVEDTGIGIPTGDQARLGERFFRSSLVSEHAIPGTGLGLTIVKAVVSAHGGSFALESEEGRGTRVTVRLPAAAQTGGNGG